MESRQRAGKLPEKPRVPQPQPDYGELRRGPVRKGAGSVGAGAPGRHGSVQGEGEPGNHKIL